MKKFNDEFKKRLNKSVSDIEDSSQVESVVIIKSKSGNYLPYGFCAAALFSFLLFSFFMFSPMEFDSYYMYFVSVSVFVLLFAAFVFIPTFLRLVVPTKILKKNSEICARAIFQKGGLSNTRQHTGFLVYCSVFERQTVIITDSGIRTSIPENDLNTLNNLFVNALKKGNQQDNIISALEAAVPIFAKYLPHRDDDINEIPDDLDVNL